MSTFSLDEAIDAVAPEMSHWTGISFKIVDKDEASKIAATAVARSGMTAELAKRLTAVEPGMGMEIGPFESRAAVNRARLILTSATIYAGWKMAGNGRGKRPQRYVSDVTLTNGQYHLRVRRLA